MFRESSLWISQETTPLEARMGFLRNSGWDNSQLNRDIG